MDLTKYVESLPTLIAIEALLAAGIMVIAGRHGSAIYWGAAGLITVGVKMIPIWG